MKLSYPLLLAIAVCTLASCATKINFLTSTVVPGAEGTVKIKKDNNTNYSVRIQLFHLATPDRLQPQQKVYVVWADFGNNDIKNLGQIKTAASLFSRTLKSSFQTVTVHRPVKIFITAEGEATVATPGMQMVLTTDGF
jgi:hypothetical protein